MLALFNIFSSLSVAGLILCSPLKHCLCLFNFLYCFLPSPLIPTLPFVDPLFLCVYFRINLLLGLTWSWHLLQASAEQSRCDLTEIIKHRCSVGWAPSRSHGWETAELLWVRLEVWATFL